MNIYLFHLILLYRMERGGIDVKIKLGDMVVRKGEKNDLLFQVTGFDGNYAVLKGIRIPIITIYQTDKLIKLNREREQITAVRRVK